MTTLGLKPTQEELAAMVAEIDTDGNGEIDFDGAHRPAPPLAKGGPVAAARCCMGAPARAPAHGLEPHSLTWVAARPRSVAQSS